MLIDETIFPNATMAVLHQRNELSKKLHKAIVKSKGRWIGQAEMLRNKLIAFDTKHGLKGLGY